MNTFILTRQAEKVFFKLPKNIQSRIIEKLKALKPHPDPFFILKNLHHFEPATHRLRIGIFRLILELKKREKEQTIFWILDLGDKKEIYR